MSDFMFSYLGARFRTEVHGGIVKAGSRFRPLNGSDYFEWKALLEAVEGCGHRFTMIDLGAGYGWWGINAAAALKARHPRKAGLIVMVEAEPSHCRWLETAIADNPYPGVRYRTVKAAIGTTSGSDWFYVGKADEWYGQRLMLDYHRKLLDDKGDDDVFADGNGLATSDGYRLREVSVVTLRNLLPRLGSIDLVDMDIQGTKADLVEAERDLLVRRVKRLFISTHSREIDERVKAALRADWDLEFALRHYAVSRLLDAGVDETRVMRIIGHSTSEMLARYRTVADRHVREAGERLDSYVAERAAAKAEKRMKQERPETVN